MDKLIESLLNINIRKNEGYIFVKQEDIYVPIIKTVLSITKRSFYRLPLLEEIVLRLINENLQEIDELANVLGIDRKLLEVTLADLSVKDIIYCTTNRCTLLSKGKQALKDLRTVQRRKDTIKNIYLDPINKKIITDYDNYQFIDKVVYNNDKKLEADITVNNIKGNETISIGSGKVLAGGKSKIEDVDIWEFPILRAGSNTIKVNREDVNVTVKYNERW